MKKGLQILLGLTLLAALAEGLILIRIRIDPWRWPLCWKAWRCWWVRLWA